jgi:hypothetical protein
MTRLWPCALAIVLLVSLTPSALAKKRMRIKTSLVAADTIVVKATVAAVDYSARTVTLKGPKGIPPSFRIDQSVENLDKIHVGDKVVARYLESVAVCLGKPQGVSLAGARNSEVMEARGVKPARIAVAVVKIKAAVETINYRKRTMSIRGPEGESLVFKLDKKIKDLRNVRAGDEIVVHYTEAVVFSLEKE